MEEQLKGMVQAILDAGATLTSVRDIDESRVTGKPFILVPDGYKTEDLEHLMTNPIRKTAEVSVTETDSFIFYTKKHGSLDECVIYAETDYAASRCVMVALINDHGSDAPHWRDHRVTFAPRQSVEWGRWLSSNKKGVSQNDFATWLEDNLPDVAAVPGMPSGSEILQMALAFEANSQKKFRSKTNLQSGSFSIEFIDEENNDTRATMKVFERFTLGIPVFEGSASAYPIEARLKYRESSGKLNFWYELIRPDRVFKTAVMDELNKIKEATGFPIIFGKP